jgi:flavin-dependent dehydrogenase
MQLPAKRGPRNDVAYFAHFEDFVHDEVEPGHIIISILQAGWSWRIPLPGRLSVGIVVNKNHAASLGSSPEERLMNAIRQEPLLREKGKNARRITDVMTYTNYQLLSERGHGPGWILLGDAFGFVDPMLSPGLFMSMEGARLLDEVLQKAPTPGPQQDKALAQYSAKVKDWHKSWSNLVSYFYNGNIFRAYLGGQQLSRTYSRFHVVRLLEKYANFQIASMASGGRTCSRYSQGFLKYLCRHVVKDVPPAECFAVKSQFVA